MLPNDANTAGFKMIQILTPTGMRHEAWALCCEWMASQNYKGFVRWIIVDDGDKPQSVPQIGGWDIVVVYPEPKWKPGQNTQCRNLLEGLKHVDDRYPVIFVEDDEHYKPGWLSRCVKELEHDDLVGQAISCKYSIALMRAREQTIPGRANLACTAIKGRMIGVFREIIERGVKLADVVMWRENQGRLFSGHYVTGIKCMPGRAGIDSGHRDDMPGRYDPYGRMLQQWIGKDAAQRYIRYRDRNKAIHKNRVHTVKRSDRDAEINHYISAYKKAEYKMGVRRKSDVLRILNGLDKTSLIDVGTGRGETLDMAHNIGFEIVAGTEVVPDLCGGRVIFAKSIDLPFEDSCSDYVTCFDVLEHLIEEDLIPTIQEMFRVCRKSIIFSCSEQPSVYDGVELHISKRPKKEWEKLIKKALPNNKVQCIGTAGLSPCFRVDKC
jgi:hypothetical protein